MCVCVYVCMCMCVDYICVHSLRPDSDAASYQCTVGSEYLLTVLYRWVGGGQSYSFMMQPTVGRLGAKVKGGNIDHDLNAGACYSPSHLHTHTHTHTHTGHRATVSHRTRNLPGRALELQKLHSVHVAPARLCRGQSDGTLHLC